MPVIRNPAATAYNPLVVACIHNDRPIGWFFDLFDRLYGEQSFRRGEGLYFGRTLC